MIKAIVDGSDGSCSSVDSLQSVVHTSGIASITTSHLYLFLYKKGWIKSRVAARRGLDVSIFTYKNKVEKW